MHFSKITFATLFFLASATMIGCSEQGNQVIQPTETYQRTEVEQANAKRQDSEREANERDRGNTPGRSDRQANP